jgi:hypothetical protein
VAEVYRAGFVGGAVEETLEWMAEKAAGCTNILVPFAGIGRATIAMTRPDTVIESYDTMHYPGCIYRGVFSATEAETNVDKIRYSKGWAFEHRGYKHLDDRCAGFMDWVAINGTEFDKACLGSAMIRSTLMGRMMHWHSNVEQFYGRFCKQREYNTDWLNQVGTFKHHEANFFDSLPLDQDYDLIEVDQPKVVNYSDVYSIHFQVQQNVLTQGEGPKLPKWNRRSVVPNIRKLMTGTKAPKIIFMYVSKVYPDYEDVKRLLQQYAEIEEENGFQHQGRTDYALLLRR